MKKSGIWTGSQDWTILIWQRNRAAKAYLDHVQRSGEGAAKKGRLLILSKVFDDWTQTQPDLALPSNLSVQSVTHPSPILPFPGKPD